MAARYGAHTSVSRLAQRLVCSHCGGREVDMVLTGTKRRGARTVSQIGVEPPRSGVEGRTVWNRRISPVAAHSDDRLLSEPTAGTQPCSREPLFLPLSRPRPCGTEPAHLGSQNENDYALEMDDDLGPMRRRKCGRGSASGNNLADPGGKPPKIAPKIGQQLTLLVPRDTHEREPGL
jgi:hypothetical protein